MNLDHRLLALLVCPSCKGALQPHRNAQLQLDELVCPVDRLAFPIRDGIAVMLEGEARALAPDEEARAPVRRPPPT